MDGQDYVTAVGVVCELKNAVHLWGTQLAIGKHGRGNSWGAGQD